VPKTKRHPKSCQATPTPVTDGTRVVVSFGSEGLYAYSMKGDLLWKQDLGVLNAGWFYDPDYEWGVGSSPIIWKNLVIEQCDIQQNSFVAAFDAKSGKQVWRTSRDEIPSWSTPTVIESGGKAELVTQGTNAIRGYDPATGQELWRLTGNSEVTVPTPIAGPGHVIVTNGYRGVQPIFAIKPGAHGDLTLKGEATSSDAIAWSTKRGGPYLPTPVIYNDLLYVLLNNGTLAAYDAKTGERVYQERLGGKGGSFSASPVAADGKIYCTSEDGDVFVVKAGKTYELLATNAVGEVLMATPAIADGVIIFRGLKHVIAIAPPKAVAARPAAP
jgi:outer membrane protein assembly factor BamB